MESWSDTYGIHRRCDPDCHGRCFLGVDAVPDHAVTRLLDATRNRTVWCTHGELMGEILARLGERGTPFGDAPEWPKGPTWRLWRWSPRGHQRGLSSACRPLTSAMSRSRFRQNAVQETRSPKDRVRLDGDPMFADGGGGSSKLPVSGISYGFAEL